MLVRFELTLFVTQFWLTFAHFCSLFVTDYSLEETIIPTVSRNDWSRGSAGALAKAVDVKHKHSATACDV